MPKPKKWILLIPKPTKPRRSTTSLQKSLSVENYITGKELLNKFNEIEALGVNLDSVRLDVWGNVDRYDDNDRVDLYIKLVYDSPETDAEYQLRLDAHQLGLEAWEKWYKKNEKQIKLQEEWEASLEKEKDDLTRRLTELKRELKGQAKLIKETQAIEEKLRYISSKK